MADDISKLPIRIHGDELTQSLIMRDSRLTAMLKNVCALPEIIHPINVLPDISHKPFGFPSGLVTRSSAHVFPMAVPDVADGYLVVNTGLRLKSDASYAAHRILALLRQLLSTSSGEPAAKLNSMLADLCVRGECSLGHDTVLECTHNGLEDGVGRESESENSSVSALSKAEISELNYDGWGQYISLYLAGSVEDNAGRGAEAKNSVLNGDVIIVVHAGAELLRPLIYKTVVMPLAQQVLEHGSTPPEFVEAGLFGAHEKDPLAVRFLMLARLANLMAFGIRRFLAAEILAALENVQELVGTGREPFIVQHSRHVNIKDLGAGADGGRIYEFSRGVQEPEVQGDAVSGNRGDIKRERSLFITGGPTTHAYLVNASASSGSSPYLCHGTPVLPLSEHELRDTYATARVSPDTVLERRADVASSFFDTPASALLDAAHLERICNYYEEAAIARRTVELRPFVNYKDAARNVIFSDSDSSS